MLDFIDNYLNEVQDIAKQISRDEVAKVASEIIKTRDLKGTHLFLF